MIKKMNKTTRSNLITYGLVIIMYLIMQGMLAGGQVNNLIKGLLIPVCVYVVMAISLNLTVGILGELSLGHAGFMCVGAFISGVFSLAAETALPNAMIRFPLAILAGAAGAAVMGMIVGIPTLRLRGDYLAIVTLAFGEIIKNIMNAIYLGRDENGFHLSLGGMKGLDMSDAGTVLIKGPQGLTLSNTLRNSTFTVSILLVLIALFIVLNLKNSRTGRAIMAIRDNRIAAESVGINISKYKLMAFTISAALAGAAGAVYSHSLASVAAKKFDYNLSILILVYVVLGGIGNIRGSIIAAAVLTLLPELLRGLQDYRMLIYAIVLILVMLFNWSPALIDLRKRYAPGRLLKKQSEKEVS